MTGRFSLPVVANVLPSSGKAVVRRTISRALARDEQRQGGSTPGVPMHPE
jgi:hypothetical protein